MKKIFGVVVLSALVFLGFSVSAQPVIGITSVQGGDKVYLLVSGPTNLSYSVQWSTNGHNFGPITAYPTSYDNKMAFLLASNVWGYFRARTISNGVTYYSTNQPLVFFLNLSEEGTNAVISVNGPANLSYTIETSPDLKNWSTSFIGVSGQTNFVDPKIFQRFYRGRAL